MNRIAIITIMVICLFPGCVSPERSMIEPTTSEEAGGRFTFESLTYSEDGSSRTSNLDSMAADEPTLLLWVGASCRGCHDWTDMLREGIHNGSLAGISVISIHRYSAFEQDEEVLFRYVGNDSENPIKWDIMLPDEDAAVVDLASGLIVDMDLYEAFQNPTTPTLQIYLPDGSLHPLDHPYWADWGELSEILDSMESMGSGDR